MRNTIAANQLEDKSDMKRGNSDLLQAIKINGILNATIEPITGVIKKALRDLFLSSNLAMPTSLCAYKNPQ